MIWLALMIVFILMFCLLVYENRVTGSCQVIVVSYADKPRYKEAMVKQRQWIHDWSHGQAAFVEYTEKDLSPEFKVSHGRVLCQSRGSGYWAWKPYCILKALQEEDADIVVYTDSLSAITEPIDQLVDRALTHGLAGYQLPDLQGHWTKADTFEHFDMNLPECYALPQRAATCMAFSNTQNSREFVRRWLTLCADPHLIDDSPSVLENPPGFREHRHDQALYSLLTYSVLFGHFIHIDQGIRHHFFG